MEPTGNMTGYRRETNEVWCLGEGCMHWLTPEEVLELGRQPERDGVRKCPAGANLDQDQVRTIQARYRRSFVQNESRVGVSGRPLIPGVCPKCGEPCESKGAAASHCRKSREQRRVEREERERVMREGLEKLRKERKVKLECSA